MKSISMVVLAVLALALVGCRANLQIERSADGGVDVTATISEQDVNAAVADALAQSNPLLRNPQVDLQPGQIVITGEHDRRDGQGTVSGSLTVTVTVQNGALLAQITSAQIEGLDLSDERIQAFNQRLSENFQRRADNRTGQITFKSVTITDNELQVVFNAKR